MAEAYGEFVSEMGQHLLQVRRAQIEAQKAENKKESATDTELIEGIVTLHKQCAEMTKSIFNDHKYAFNELKYIPVIIISRLFCKVVKDAFSSFVNENAGQKTNVS
jgi:hypothetical protein